MGIITLYHGSQNIIETPVYGYGNVYNDYGIAFYCTENMELAKEWAVTSDRDGFANRYEFDTTGLKELNLSDGNYTVLNWLAILLENRKFRINSDMGNEAKKYIIDTFGIDYSSYDFIRGYRADDSYFSFANAFLNNGLSMEKLYDVMHLGKLGEQIAIKSEKGINCLKFVNSIPASKTEYFYKKESRDRNAREDYQRSKGTFTKGTYIIDILRERWQRDDERIQRIIY